MAVQSGVPRKTLDRRFKLETSETPSTAELRFRRWTMAAYSSIKRPEAVVTLMTPEQVQQAVISWVGSLEAASVSDLGRFQLNETPKLNLEASTLGNVWRFYEKMEPNLRLRTEVSFTHRVYSLARSTIKGCKRRSDGTVEPNAEP